MMATIASSTSTPTPTPTSTFHLNTFGPTEVAKFRAYDSQHPQDPQQPGNGFFDTSSGRMNSQDGNGEATTSPESMTEGGMDTCSLSPGKAKSKAKVPIPRVSRISKNNSGPASKAYELPPRPKPGRKPIESDPHDKRKSQNREAQRSFRDRRAQKVQDLENTLEDLVKSHDAQLKELRAEMLHQAQKHQQEIEQHKRDIEKWKSEAERMTQLVEETQRQHNSAPPPAMTEDHRYSYSAVPTPPEDKDEMETDFTAMFASRKPAFSLGEDFEMANSPYDDPCGFCVSPDNCQCAEDRRLRQAQALPPINVQRAIEPVQLKPSLTPSFLEAPTKATGPGQCDMCLTDPERAARCQALAASSQYSRDQQRKQSASSTPTTSTASATAAESARMSCTDFFTKAQQHNVKLGPDVFSRVHAYPYTRHGEAGPTHSPALEIDAHDAAHALAEMSRGHGPAERL